MVIWVRQTHSLNDALPNYLAHNITKVRNKAFTEEDFVVLENTWGAEYYDKIIRRLPSELEVTKHTYSAFEDTKLDRYLKARGIKTLVYIGGLTNGCLGSTAIAGWDKGYYSIIPSDTTASNDLSLHKAFLKNHSLLFGLVPKSDEIIEIWRKKK